MLAPLYIQRELQLINPLYFAIFNPYIDIKTDISYGKRRWQIRKWLGTYPRRLDLWNTDASENIMTICKEEYSNDMGLHDAGYEEVDQRAITAIRKSYYWKMDWKKKIAEIDWNNEQLERKAKEELDYQTRYAAKLVWRHLHEPTVNLSGKKWKK